MAERTINVRKTRGITSRELDWNCARNCRTRWRPPSRCLLLPASTQISVNADQSHKLIQLSLSESQLGIKVIGFVGQHLQVAGGSASVAHLRKLCGVLSGERQVLLVLPKLLVLVILN